MDSFEKQNAKNILETLKAINRNINYLGRKLEITNDILKKQGIAIIPTTTTTEEPGYEEMVRLSDIEAWKSAFLENSSFSDQDTKFGIGCVAVMVKDLIREGKVVNIDIQKGE